MSITLLLFVPKIRNPSIKYTYYLNWSIINRLIKNYRKNIKYRLCVLYDIVHTQLQSIYMSSTYEKLIVRLV